jgi:hypothetical protein
MFPFPQAAVKKKDSSPVALEQTAGRVTSPNLYLLCDYCKKRGREGGGGCIRELLLSSQVPGGTQRTQVPSRNERTTNKTLGGNKQGKNTNIPPPHFILRFHFFTCLFEFFCVPGIRQSWLFGGCSSGSDRQVATGGQEWLWSQVLSSRPLIPYLCGVDSRFFACKPIQSAAVPETTAYLCIIEVRTATIKQNEANLMNGVG